jgi:hypothetical protein
MSTFLIGYDLDAPGQDYTDLIARLKDFGIYWHNLDSTWIVVSDSTAADIRGDLKKYIDKNDKLLVIKITGDNWASYGFGDEANKWLHDHV